MKIVLNNWPQLRTRWTLYGTYLPFTGYVIREHVLKHIKNVLGSKKINDVRRSIHFSLTIKPNATIEEWAASLQTVTQIDTLVECDMIVRLFVNVLVAIKNVHYEDGKYTADVHFTETLFRIYKQIPAKHTLEDSKHVANLIEKIKTSRQNVFKFANQTHILRYAGKNANALEVFPFDSDYFAHKPLEENDMTSILSKFRMTVNTTLI